MVKQILLKTVLVLMFLAPTTAHAWWSEDWAQRQSIRLNGQAISGLTQEVTQAPVLVRLHSGVLDFSQVNPDGSDLRFIAGDDRTPLNYHIERFDPVAELGLVWINVPDVLPGATQDIWVYYGNQEAVPVANPAATYDGEQSLVLHLDGAGTGPVDETANANRATFLNVQPTLEGMIAGGATLFGDSNIRVDASPSLAITANGRMSWSAWVKPSASDTPEQAMLYTKLPVEGEAAPQRFTIRLQQSVPVVAVTGADGTVQETAAETALAPDTWAHLAVTAGNGLVTLYVDGSPVATLEADLPALAGDEIIGAVGDQPGFIGDLDEVNRANDVRSASAIALAAQSQNRSASFVSISPATEELEAPSHNYFGVLFAALTVDAWVVIVILGMMMVISAYVMIIKAIMLRRVTRSNAVFLQAYEAAMTRHNEHDALTDNKLAAMEPDSTLGRLFRIGQRALGLRLAEARQTGGLAPQSVASIRAALDAGQAREAQGLNRWMVLLTIAISGGPFVGLLGTVLGVMITFAAVAAAGDVNINAIAPGIAAALLATVAGLAVAIPALFGYNYLLSRIGEIETDNEIFIDELEKRIAETWRGKTASAPALQTAE